MKLYDGGRAPNPRRVRVFLAEKGITVPIEQVDLGKMAHKSPAYAAINPVQRVPALELDDGTVISELIAICRYFEAQQPEPPLFGVGPKDDGGGRDVGAAGRIPPARRRSRTSSATRTRRWPRWRCRRCRPGRKQTSRG